MFHEFIKESNAAVIGIFRAWAATHALGRRDRLHGSRRGGMFFLSRAREENPGMAKPFP